MTDEDILTGILRRESGGRPETDAGVIDHPADRGGVTSIWGITLDSFGGTREELAALTGEQARAIYRARFIHAPHFDRVLNDALRALIVDAGVNHGPKRATEMIQKSLGIPVDGIFGPVTQAAVNQAPTLRLYANLCAARVRKYGAIISHDARLSAAKAAGFRLQAENAGGWANRVAEFIDELGEMAS